MRFQGWLAQGRWDLPTVRWREPTLSRKTIYPRDDSLSAYHCLEITACRAKDTFLTRGIAWRSRGRPWEHDELRLCVGAAPLRCANCKLFIRTGPEFGMESPDRLEFHDVYVDYTNVTEWIGRKSGPELRTVKLIRSLSCLHFSLGPYQDASRTCPPAAPVLQTCRVRPLKLRDCQARWQRDR